MSSGENPDVGTRNFNQPNKEKHRFTVAALHLTCPGGSALDPFLFLPPLMITVICGRGPGGGNSAAGSLHTSQLIYQSFVLRSEQNRTEEKGRSLRTAAEMQPLRLPAYLVARGNSQIMDDEASWSQPFH